MNAPVYKILIVEDSTEDRYILRRRLQDNNVRPYTITEAKTGADGLKQCHTIEPDCILLDYNLPDLNGLEFIRQLRSAMDGREPAVIMLTGLGNEAIAVEAMKAGAQDYLVKAQAHERIHQAIGNAIDKITQRRRLDAETRKVEALSQEREELIFELQRRATELAEVDRRKDVFLATLAHELRNPLAPIQSAMDVLKIKYPEDAQLGGMRQIVERQVGHLASLVNDLTDLARISSGKVELKREPITLADVIAQAIEICQDLLNRHRHTIDLSYPPEPVLLNADRVRLVQILVNVLANACKYTPKPSTIELVARVDDNFVIFTITDNGIGIDATELSQIFNVFAQVAPPVGQPREGLGIGLSLAKQFTELHGGTIVPASKGLNHGSVFTITLPIVIQSRDDGTSAPRADEVSPSYSDGRKVLIVDDNADAVDVLEMLFKASGYKVVKAYNGRDAVTAAEAFKPEIIVMDLGMPGLSGCEALRRIKKRLGEGVFAIAVSGWNQDSARRETRDAGFDHHLVKPVDFNLIKNLLKDSVS